MVNAATDIPDSSLFKKSIWEVMQNLDLKFMEDVYESLGSVVKTAPETFKELAKAVARFYEKKGG